MPATRARTTVIATVALATSATLGLASAATAADIATYPFAFLPGLTINTPYPDYELEVDCDEWVADAEYGDVELVWVPGGSLLVSLTCVPDSVIQDWIDEDLDEGEFPSGVEGVMAETGFDVAYEVDPNTRLEIEIGDETFVVEYWATIEIDDPTGGRLFTETLTTPANGAQAVDFADGEAVNDNDFECNLGGERVYALAEFTVLEGGEFTFRIVDVAPRQSGEFRLDDGDFEWWIYYPNPWGDYVPISDPYLVLYKNFDAGMPNDGQVGCNDDTNAIDLSFSADPRDSLDRYISDVYSELVLELEPGQYTLMLTTWDSVGALDLGLDEVKIGSASESFAPAEYQLDGLPVQSAVVEFWGADDSLELGHTELLADTGPQSVVPGWLAGGAVLALLVGALSIAIARRHTARID